MATTFFQIPAAKQVIGTITQPSHLTKFGGVAGGAIGTFIGLIFNILVVTGGVYALFNFIMAGYSFLSAGDDPQKVSDSWKKIWQTILGLFFIVGAFLLAAIIGLLLYGSSTALLKPVIPTP